MNGEDAAAQRVPQETSLGPPAKGHSNGAISPGIRQSKLAMRSQRRKLAKAKTDRTPVEPVERS
ncbi:MAG: hypothetical protein ACJ79H_12395 [Myxococcales bacterium]